MEESVKGGVGISMKSQVRYSEAVADEVIFLLANNKPLKFIERQPGLPNSSTIVRWAYEHEGFAIKCARARLIQSDLMAEEVAEITSEVREGKLSPEQGRVCINALQWLAAKKNPRVYGDKTILSNDPENPVSLLAVRLDQALARKTQVIEGDYKHITDNSDLTS